MKAVTLDKLGVLNNLVYRDLPEPSIKEDEVLIKVKALSINPVDVKVRKAEAPLAQDLSKHDPLILGWDVSGEITKIGSVVKDFHIGDEVFGMVNFPGHGQCYAEYVAAPSIHIAKKPVAISHVQAAASTLAALTALQTFNSYGKLRSGDKVLIHAAAGGVGHFAIQLAKYMGAHVTATSSPGNKDFVLAMGADFHIDYTVQDFSEILSDMDFVLEAVGGTNFQKSVRVLKPFGTIVALPSGHTPKDEIKAKQKNLHACYFMSVYSNKADMEQIASLLHNGIIKPHISQVFGFNKIEAAHQQIQSGRTVGKIVVEI